MILRKVLIPKDEDLRASLSEAEKLVDSLSDEQLDRYERELESRILGLVSPAPSLKLVSPSPRKEKLTVLSWTAFSGILVAAMALFFLKPTRTDDLSPSWQTKGPGVSEEIACSITVQQPRLGSAELSESGYLVKRELPIYLKTSCRRSLAVEVLHEGIWQTQLKIEVRDGFVVQSGQILDLRQFLGAPLRLRGPEGVSEEFILIDEP